MRNASQSFIHNIENGGVPHIKAYIQYADGTNEWVYDDDFMSGSITFQNGTSSSGSFEVGGAVIGSFNFNLNNWNDKFTNRVFAGATITAYVGYELRERVLTFITELGDKFFTEDGIDEFVTDAQNEWIRYGTYYFVDHKSIGHVIRCETYDSMKLFDENMLSDLGLYFPITAGDAARAIATHNGVALASQRFPGYQTVLSAEPDNDITERQAIAYIAQLCGCYARIDSNADLVFDWYGNPVGTISRRFDHDIDTDDITITGVRLTYDGEDGEETYLEGAEGYVLALQGNPWITASNYEDIAETIGDNVIGMTFRPGGMTVLANPLYEAGDVVQTYDDRGILATFIITNLSYGLSLRESLSCDAETRDKRDLRGTESNIAVERAKKYTASRLTAFDMQYLELSRLMSMSMGMFETREYDDTGGFVLYLHNKPNLADSDTVWKKTADAFAVSTDYNTPNPTWNAGITADGKALVNVLAAIGITADWIETGKIRDALGYNEWNLDTGAFRLNAATQVGTGGDTLSSMQTAISANAQGLSLEITNRQTAVSSEAQARANAVTAEKNRAEGAESALSLRITANAEGLTSKVSTTDYNGETIASMINQSASSVTINANKINLTLGNANNTDGVMTIKNGSGTVIGRWNNAGVFANAGTIGGWTIAAAQLHKTLDPTASAAGYRIRLLTPATPTNTSLAIAVGTAAATSGDASWANTFYVRYDGYIYAVAGGRIGAWTLGTGTSGALYNGKGSLTDANDGLFMSPDGIALGKSNAFKVTKAGVLTATSGKVGGFNITGDAIYYGKNSTTSTANGFYLGRTAFKFGAGRYCAFEVDATESICIANILKFRNSDGNVSGYGWSVASDHLNRIATGGAIRTNSENSGEDNSLGGDTWANIVGGSDERMKEDVQSLDVRDSVALIKNLRPVSFKFKNGYGTKGLRHGLIAQEVLEHIGDWAVVSKDSDGYYGISYTEFIADLIAVVQDQQKRIEALEARA